MIFLLLSILSGITIVVCFKLYDRLGINTFQAIIINYLTAFVLGFLLTRKEMIMVLTMESGELLSALIIGMLFVVMFRVLGKSVQKAGMGISTISAKISVAIPITFSILFFHESISTIKITGIMLALTSLIFAINNTGILALTVLTGVLFFRERLNLINWVGFTLSLISIYIIFV